MTKFFKHGISVNNVYVPRNRWTILFETILGLAWAILHQLSSKWQCRLKVFLWKWFWFTYNYTYQWLVDKLDNDDIMSVNASEEAGKIPTDELALRKKWSFPLRISSENATKSAGNCEFGHIYWGNPY